jgi:hypothetical protein
MTNTQLPVAIFCGSFCFCFFVPFAAANLRPQAEYYFGDLVVDNDKTTI